MAELRRQAEELIFACAKRLGLRWVRGEGTHRFGESGTHLPSNIEPQRPAESGVSPIPRQPPQSKTLRGVTSQARFSAHAPEFCYDPKKGGRFALPLAGFP